MTVEQHCRDRAARADERSLHFFALARVCEDSIRKTIYEMEAVRWKQESEAWLMTLVVRTGVDISSVAEFQERFEERFGPLSVQMNPREEVDY